MRPDEYRCIYEACLAIAAQSTDADVRARWLAMAEEALKQSRSSPRERIVWLGNFRMDMRRGPLFSLRSSAAVGDVIEPPPPTCQRVELSR